VEGNGQSELIDVILGLQTPLRGTVQIDGQDMSRTSTRHRREKGLGYIPQDRQRDGLVLDAPLWENCALGHQTTKPYSKGWMIDRAGARKRTEQIIRDYDVRTPGPNVAALALSGGNQQKLIVGREMEAKFGPAHRRPADARVDGRSSADLGRHPHRP
jgi:simple sugar transport system ATP-binding protein